MFSCSAAGWRTRRSVALCVALQGVGGGAWAWGSLLLTDAPPEADHLALGGTLWSVPRSSGSARQNQLLLPAIDYQRADGLFVSTDMGVGQNLSPWRQLQAGWRVWPQFGRDRKDASAELPVHGPRWLKQVFANVQVTDWLLAQSTVSAGGGRTGQGLSTEVGLTSGVPLGDELLGVGVAATQGNRAFRRDETGEAKSGWSDTSVALSMEHRWTKEWRVDAQWQQVWLLGDKSAMADRGVHRHQHLLTVSVWRDF